MAGKYKFSEVEVEEIRAARRANTNKRAEVRLKALELRAMGNSSKDIGVVTCFHAVYITTLTAKYRVGGISDSDLIARRTWQVWTGAGVVADSKAERHGTVSLLQNGIYSCSPFPGAQASDLSFLTGMIVPRR